MNIVDVKVARSLAGKASRIASLLRVWRPFVGMLWAPMFDSRSKCRHSPEHVWFRAVKIPLTWIKAFLVGAKGTLCRVYTLASYLGEGDRVTITTDASPLGLGALLIINNIIVEFAFGFISREDQRRLQASTSGSSGQQVWEALAVLAALRLWKGFFVITPYRARG